MQKLKCDHVHFVITPNTYILIELFVNKFFCEIVLFLLHISKMHKCRISTALFCVDFNFFLSLSLSLIFILFYFNVLSLIC